jgi:hypothetical protein
MVKWKKVEDKFGHSTPLVHTPIFNELNVIELVEPRAVRAVPATSLRIVVAWLSFLVADCEH